MIAAEDMPCLASESAFVGSSLAVFTSFYLSVLIVPMLLLFELPPATDGLTPSFLELLAMTFAPSREMPDTEFPETWDSPLFFKSRLLAYPLGAALPPPPLLLLLYFLAAKSATLEASALHFFSVSSIASLS